MHKGRVETRRLPRRSSKKRGGAVSIASFLFLWVSLVGELPALATQLSDLLFSKGMVDFSEGKFEDGLEKFRQAAEAEPGDANIQFMLGSTYNKLGVYQEAQQALERALQLDPQLQQVHYELGVAHFKLDHLEDALAQFQLAHALEPDRAMVHYYQGFIYHHLKQYDRSPPFFQRARELAPELALTTHYYSGIAYFRREQFKLAEGEFQHAIEADPESDVAESAKRFLAETRDLLEQYRPFRWVFSVGSEYDSNVSSLPEGIQPGDVPELARQGDFRENIFASLEYRPLITPMASLGFGYSFNQSVHHNLSSFDLQSHVLSFSASRLLQPVQIRLDGASELHFLAGSAFLQRNLLGPSLTFIEASWAATSLSYRFQTLRRFDDTNRDGLNHNLGVQQFFLFQRATRLVRLGFNLEAEDTDGPDFDFVGYEVSTGFLNPFFKGTPFEVALNFDFRYGRRDYQHVDSRFGEKRDETRHTYALGLSKELGRRIGLDVRYSLLVNRSNIRAFTYDRQLTSIGVTVRF